MLNHLQTSIIAMSKSRKSIKPGNSDKSSSKWPVPRGFTYFTIVSPSDLSISSSIPIYSISLHKTDTQVLDAISYTPAKTKVIVIGRIYAKSLDEYHIKTIRVIDYKLVRVIYAVISDERIDATMKSSAKSDLLDIINLIATHQRKMNRLFKLIDRTKLKMVSNSIVMDPLELDTIKKIASKGKTTSISAFLRLDLDKAPTKFVLSDASKRHIRPWKEKDWVEHKDYHRIRIRNTKILVAVDNLFYDKSFIYPVEALIMRKRTHSSYKGFKLSVTVMDRV